MFPFVPNSDGLSENKYFKCARDHTTGTWPAESSISSSSVYVKVCQMCPTGEELGKLDPEAKV